MRLPHRPSLKFDKKHIPAWITIFAAILLLAWVLDRFGLLPGYSASDPTIMPM